jgi:radical SAM superfamily enzyme YgiQ (UPF0313 family)
MTKLSSQTSALIPILSLTDKPDIDFQLDKLRNKLVGRKKSVKKILFINPVQINIDEIDLTIARNRRYYVYPPYGIGILNTLIRNRGYDSAVIDLNYVAFEFIHRRPNALHDEIKAEVEAVLAKALREESPDVVGVSCTFTMNHSSMSQIFRQVRKFDPEIITLAGGVHVTNASEFVLRDIPEIDLVQTHEAEESFPDLIDFLSNGYDGIVGQIVFLLDRDIVQISTKKVPSGVSLDVVPNYGGLPLGSYSSLGEIGTFRYWRPKESNSGSILSNKGCRARCSFCSVPNFNGKGVRGKSVQTVIDEIKKQNQEYGIDHFTWLDDDLFYDAKRALELFNRISQENLNITWDASNGLIASAAVTNPDVVAAAAQSGCIGAYFGIESGNDEILKKIHKPSGVKHYRQLGPLMNSYPQIFTRGFLIIGFPNETLNQILDTIRVSVDMGLDWYSIQLLTPLPSTEIYNEMVQAGKAKADTLNIEGGGYTMFSVRESERQRKIEKSYQRDINDFTNLLEANGQHIPTQAELDDLWFWTDYTINYKPIFTQTDPNKLMKLECFLSDISDRMTRDNALANYFLSIVLEKLGKQQESQNRLSNTRKHLSTSDYWLERFKILNLPIN